jgi:phospholipid-translocating ATPase
MSFVLTTTFVAKVGIIVAVSSVPLWAFKVVRQRWRPAAYAKVADF